MKTITSSLVGLLLALGLTANISASSADTSLQAEIITQNNEGVTALNKGRFDEAIACFENALRLQHSYKLARDNLSLTFLHYSEKFEAQPYERLRLLDRGLLISPNGFGLRSEIEKVMLELGLNPKKFGDHMKLAMQCADRGDDVSAAAQYFLTLQLEADEPLARSRLTNLIRILHKRNVIVDYAVQQQAVPKPKESSDEDKSNAVLTFDRETYSLACMHIIRDFWCPPDKGALYKLCVACDVDWIGNVSNIRIEKSSGFEDVDSAAILAVKRADPFPELPEGARNHTVMRFDFSSNDKPPPKTNDSL